MNTDCGSSPLDCFDFERDHRVNEDHHQLNSLLLIRHDTKRIALSVCATLTYLYEIKAGQQGNAVFGHLAFESFLRRHDKRYVPLKKPVREVSNTEAQLV